MVWRAPVRPATPHPVARILLMSQTFAITRHRRRIHHHGYDQESAELEGADTCRPRTRTPSRADSTYHDQVELRPSPPTCNASPTRSLVGDSWAIARDGLTRARFDAVCVGLAPLRVPQPPIDRVVWRLQKAQRTVQAVVRLIPRAGVELRIDVDGDLRWSQAYGWNARELDAEAERKRDAFRERGWSDVAAGCQM